MLKPDEQPLARLVNEVLTSAKYKDMSQDLIRSIGQQELVKRRNVKEAIKATKNKLHQVSGAYLDGREQYGMWLTELRAASLPGDKEKLQQTCMRIMSHHTSTRERLPILDSFYNVLLTDLAPIHSILDIASGLNPLARPWMPLAEGTTYYAYDIYAPMMRFLNDYMTSFSLQGHAQVQNVLQSCPTDEVDLAFVLKTIPCLEQVDKQAGYRLLRAIRARYMIVSFPVHSLGGRGKGMTKYYEDHFRQLVDGENWSIEKIEFATELVFVIRR